MLDLYSYTLLNRKTVFSIVTVSLIVTAVLYTLFLRYNPPVNMAIDEAVTQKKLQNVFHDFNHDGDPERIKFFYISNKNQYKISIINSSGTTYRTWNIEGRWLQNGYLIGDYNNDNEDELFVLVQKHVDSVYIYNFNVGKGTVQKHFLTVMRNFIPSIGLKLTFLPGKLKDVDGDGSMDLIFGLHPHHYSIAGKGMYVFSLRKRKILYFNPLGNVLPSNIMIEDADNDGEEEIIVTAEHSVKVTEDRFKYSPAKCWIFILNKKLEFSAPPVSFDGTGSYLKTAIIKVKNKNYIVAAHFRPSIIDGGTTLLLLDGRGNIKESSETLSSVYEPRLFIYHGDNDNNFIILKNSTKEPAVLEKYDANLRPAGKYKLSFGTNLSLIKEIYLPSFSSPFMLLLGNHQLVVTDTEFQPLNFIKIEKPYRYYTASDYVKGNGYFIGLSGWFTYELVEIKINDLYRFRYFFLIFGFLLLASLLGLGASKTEKLRIKLNLLPVMLDSTSSSIFITDEKEKIIFANKHFLDRLDLNSADIMEKKAQEVLPQSPQLIKFIKSVINTCTDKKINIITPGTMGAVRGKLEGQCIRGTFPFSMFFIFVLAEETNSPKINTWNDSLRKMVHDIKTPIATIGLNLQTLRLKLAKGVERDALYGNMEIIERELQRVKKGAQQFLKFSDLQSPVFTEIYLDGFLREITNRYDTQTGEQIKVVTEDRCNKKDITVSGDKRLLEMVLNILIENGIQAVEPSGTVTVISETDPYGSMITISVADTGCGIPPEVLPKITEPFFTTKEDGNGLGLAVASQIIAGHGSELHISSEPEKGTKISFELTRIN